jgi:hypothetical protein
MGLVVGAALAAAVAGCASPLVGGECLPGLTVCEGRCVNTDYDRYNCGACGHVCSASTVCIQGACAVEGDAGWSPEDDAGAPDDGGGAADGGRDAGAGEDGSAGEDAGQGADDGGAQDDGGSGGGEVDGGGQRDGGTGTADGGTEPSDGGSGTDAGTTDGGTAPTCDLGQIVCAGACVDPDSDVAHCGGCDSPCAADDLCSGGLCVDACHPQTECDGVCVDTFSHPDHCGGCGIECASGLCIDGECSSGLVGHIAIIGHDYRDSRVGMNRVAGNAVFLASGAPVRVLVYEGAADAASMAGVDAAIDQVAASNGRTWTRTAAAADRVPHALAQADVFVVYSQHGATDAALRSVGASWATALYTYLRRGGVLVLFDGGGSHAGTWQVLDAAGLFTATGRTIISGDAVRVVEPGSALALNVPRTYRAEAASVRFHTAEASVVVEHDAGPVVIHRLVLP